MISPRRSRLAVLFASILIAPLFVVGVSSPAFAESVVVPGQGDCPGGNDGWRRGVEVNATTGETVTRCTRTPVPSAVVDPYPGLATGAEVPGTRVWSTTETSWPAFATTTMNQRWACPYIETPNFDPYAGENNGFDAAVGKWFRVCVKNPWVVPGTVTVPSPSTPTPTPSATPSDTSTASPRVETVTVTALVETTTPVSTPTPVAIPATSTTVTPATLLPCTGGTGRIPGLPQCLMPEGVGGSVWNEVDNVTGQVLNGAVCSAGVCGRNGEWRTWPSNRLLNDRYFANGFPERSTYIQTPFDYGYWGHYFTNGVWEVNGGGIIQPGSSVIVYPARVVETSTVVTDTRTVTAETGTVSTPTSSPTSPVGAPAGTESATAQATVVTAPLAAPVAPRTDTGTVVAPTTMPLTAETVSSGTQRAAAPAITPVIDVEGVEEDPAAELTVKKDSTGRYIMTITSNIIEDVLTITATRKGYKTISFKATTNENGSSILRTTRNLAGFKLVLRFDGDIMDSAKA